VAEWVVWAAWASRCSRTASVKVERWRWIEKEEKVEVIPWCCTKMVFGGVGWLFVLYGNLRSSLLKLVVIFPCTFGIYTGDFWKACSCVVIIAFKGLIGECEGQLECL